MNQILGTEKQIEGTGRSEIEDKYEVSSNKEDTKVLKDESDTTTENKTVETAGSEIEDKYDGSSNKEEDTAVSHDELKTGTEKKNRRNWWNNNRGYRGSNL